MSLCTTLIQITAAAERKHPLMVYPRPQFVRSDWVSLDGSWRYAFNETENLAEVTWAGEILVPYPPESKASGLNDQGFHPVVWYTRTFTMPETWGQQPTLLHFGAVDYSAKVWVNGHLVATHQGGHTPFSADISSALQAGQQTVVVRAEDDPHSMTQTRGKQDWRSDPHIIWYPRTTGIWQTVWLESVPQTRLGSLEWNCNLEQWDIGLSATVLGDLSGLTLRVQLSARGQTLADDRITVTKRNLTRRIALDDPGIDDERRLFLWSPEYPNLINATVQLLRGDTLIDEVTSYTALRSVGTDNHRFMLNGDNYILRMVLDQGYWPEGLLAATDEQLRADVELTKHLGFNGARKHQKIENPRWLYWCDVLGLLVWEEMPSHYAFSSEAAEHLSHEWAEVIKRDRSHPCIMAWVPFNESWGVPDLKTNPTHQHYVKAIYHLTKTLDPTRLAITNDGWEYAGGDWLGIHDYSNKPEKFLERYGNPQAFAYSLARPWGRALAVAGSSAENLPIILSEFGGIAFSKNDGDNWGYSRAPDSDVFLQRYEALLETVNTLKGFAGFCYTQLTDTFQERNGLLTENREPKADITKLAAATRGERTPWELEMEGEGNPMNYSKRWYAHFDETKTINISPSSGADD
jgi:Glycosyl hydrolases family 2, sugar binding domain/Glycosyl hydrolases family 2, TIM barrel domain